MGSRFGVGRCTTHFRGHFSGDWDVHWGYGLLTHTHICFFEDIVDTGKTLKAVCALFAERGAASVTICTLLDKKAGCPPAHSGRVWFGCQEVEPRWKLQRDLPGFSETDSPLNSREPPWTPSSSASIQSESPQRADEVRQAWWRSPMSSKLRAIQKFGDRIQVWTCNQRAKDQSNSRKSGEKTTTTWALVKTSTPSHGSCHVVQKHGPNGPWLFKAGQARLSCILTYSPWCSMWTSPTPLSSNLASSSQES